MSDVDCCLIYLEVRNECTAQRLDFSVIDVDSLIKNTAFSY